MQDSHSNNIRILKNTVFLYARTFIIMLVALYASRVILDVLGESDYGIYQIVGGVIICFSVISNALVSATQRFFSYEIGRGQDGNIKKTYSMSIIVHFVISLFILILGETVGLWFVNAKLDIPEERMFAMNVVYQISLITFIIQLIRIPANAAIIAYEKMSFYAYISIFEALLKLLIVYLLLVVRVDKLILYGALVLLVTLVINVCYQYYVHAKFEECRFTAAYDLSIIKQLFSYISWTMVGGVATVGSQQGGNILLNMFHGVSMNAAFGVASQVDNAIYGFVSNFQTAFRPQIVKLYASKEYDSLFLLVNRASRLSFYLLLVIALPFLFHADFILGLWLKTPPSMSAPFCQWLMIYMLVDAIQAPLWMFINATGEIKTYELWLSALIILNIPISYYLLRLGYPPVVVLIIRVCINVISAIIRTCYVKYAFGFPSWIYVKEAFKCITIALLSVILCFVVCFCTPETMLWNAISLAISILSTGLIIFCIGLKASERSLLLDKIKSIINR